MPRRIRRPQNIYLVAQEKPKAPEAVTGGLAIFEASWKPLAAIAVPVAVALSPVIYKYYTFD